MFLRLVYESFRRQKRRKLLAGVAITVGAAVATAMIAVATDIGDKVSRELRSFGANLIVTPQEDTLDVQVGGVDLKPPSDGAYLEESDLPKIKTMIWRNNILGFAPMLPVPVTVEGQKVTLLGTYFAKTFTSGKDQFITGVTKTHTWWKVRGAWPADDSSDVLLGERLAARLGKSTGESITVEQESHRISGILSTGGAEDDEIVAPLGVAQQIIGRPGAVRRIYISALTKPEDALARRDPKSMSPAVYDRWYCSPYAQSIAYQLQEVIPHSHAEPIRQVAQNEGKVLSSIEGLMLFITVAALFAAALAVSSAMASAIFERRGEVGLMRALGAGGGRIMALFCAEAALLALAGGGSGFAGGVLLAHEIGLSIFRAQIGVQPVLLPIVLGVAFAVTFAGSAAAIRRAVRFNPVSALRSEI